MTTIKKLSDIAWNVTEEEYRADPAISYSTLAKFHREGFAKLDSLFDKVDSPSLLFGSMVDSLLTDGEGAFNNRFQLVTYQPINDSQKRVCDYLLHTWEGVPFNRIPDAAVGEACTMMEYQKNWRPDTRVKVIKEQCASYYDAVMSAQGKTPVSQQDMDDCNACVEALKNDDATSFYFAEDNPFDGIERCYQFKFKGEYNGIEIRGMADLIIANHNDKTIQMTDLKTTHSVLTFNDSFYKWCYFIQAKLYTELMRQTIEKDDYFKDFKILPTYKFITIDRYIKKPVVYTYNENFSVAPVIDLDNKEHPDWRDILQDLNYYLTEKPILPLEITRQTEKSGEVELK